ncbi:hypothetical protein DIPPA_05523 [Diplonema papillatum]|nr:hypothetical protein DIPPA_05523 [Diplonema papillatum]
MRDRRTSDVWRDLGCGQRAEDVILELQLEYVVPGHAFGSDCVCALESRFEPLREWLYVAESLEGWRGRRQFVSLGELLLRELRIEFVCAREGFSRKEFQMQLQLESEDALDRAAAGLWWERRQSVSGAPPSEERPRRRRRRIPPAVRRRRKRDQGEAVTPPRQPDLPNAPLLPPRPTDNQSTNPTGMVIDEHQRGTASSSDTRATARTSPNAGGPLAQRLSADSGSQSDAARGPAGATTCGYAAHDIGHSGGVGCDNSCPDAQRPGPVGDFPSGEHVACSDGTLRPGPEEDLLGARSFAVGEWSPALGMAPRVVDGLGPFSLPTPVQPGMAPLGVTGFAPSIFGMWEAGAPFNSSLNALNVPAFAGGAPSPGGFFPMTSALQSVPEYRVADLLPAEELPAPPAVPASGFAALPPHVGDDLAPLSDVVGRRVHGFTRRAHNTRLPQSQAEKEAPLHVAAVPAMDTEALRLRMKPDVRVRFDSVWNATFSPVRGAKEGNSSEGQQRRSHLMHSHASELVRLGIASPSDTPGTFRNVPFTVVEDKAGRLRQRFILWTQEANDLLSRQGYVAQVPLGHVSGYLDVVESECATTRDLRCGFYQVEVPEEARKNFGFLDEQGNAYVLNRLPMGHSCAPELMHTLTATLASHPDFVGPEFTADGVTVHAWVDNIRISGSRAAVLCQTEELDRLAARVHASWKPEDSNDASSGYDFIGVTFDHGRKTVSPAARLIEKIRAVDLSSPTAGDLESLGGRLLHASAVVNAFPGSFWFAVKFLRRITNGLNKGTRTQSETVLVPASVRRDLRSWVDSVDVNRRFTRPSTNRPYAVYVDASLLGWGAVLVDRQTAELTVLGGTWTEQEARHHINTLEALALKRAVDALPPSVLGSAVDVHVDNTTVVGVARKKNCMLNKSLNDAVVHALTRLRDLKCSWSISWISTKENPADVPSRVALAADASEEDRQRLLLAVRAFFTRGGAGGVTSSQRRS